MTIGESFACLRTERLGSAPEHEVVAPSADAARIGNLLHGPDGLSCACGTVLAPPGGDFKDGCVTRVVDGADHGRIVLHPELEIREHSCPGCGALIESEVVRSGQESLRTIALAVD